MFLCKANVILYDEEEMKCYGGYIKKFTVGNPIPFDVTTLEDNFSHIIKIPPITATAILELRHQIVELDPTTMKRIARFSLEKENEELFEEIKRNKREIKNLKSEYNELRERLKVISEIGKDIWENGTEYMNFIIFILNRIEMKENNELAKKEKEISNKRWKEKMVNIIEMSGGK